ncbi:hypothetical protein QYS48_23220 [Marivirga arenosa]|uniref:Cytochrome B n=1 Tax=Marivirga arenosa TaxID=3059076 RepID=A0AA49GDU0_9BACT|nr:hypothetical protein [Marivirga sp. ABR2-2]WKK84931.1 hypothetical protein QYS48_23220 [Marivirga sp. ABR2-2]
MYNILKHAHSGIAYLLLLALVIALVYNIIGWAGNKAFTKGNKIAALIGFISSHLQLLLGLILYFVSPLGLSNLSGETMSDSMSRLYALEHPLTMIIAIVLITIGYSKSKRAEDDKSKYKKIVLFYAIGLILILSRIPWSVWPA